MTAMLPPNPQHELAGITHRYRVLRQLGEGSQKRVYLAEDSRLGRSVAISVLETRTLARSQVERLHEARAMARIGDHPHVVSVYDVIESSEYLYIVCQFLAGGDLETLLASRERRALPLPEVVHIASDVCRALEHAHANGISHCDVKPANLFLDEQGNALLGDFGFAEMNTLAESRGGQILGTPAYLAPEQISRSERGPSCDLYALGCLLYELSTGRPPFVATHASDVLRLHQVARPTPPAERDRSLPTALSDLILKLLEKEPASRPSSARDVRAALAGILDLGALQSEVRAGGKEPRKALSPEPRRESELVGREAPLARLGGAIERAQSGVPGLVLVTAEAGMGKSRLLGELRRRAERSGCLVLIGQGFQDAPFPLRPIIDALLPLAGRLSELDPDHANLIRALLFQGGGAKQPEMLTGREAHHHQLFVAVLAALEAFSVPRPIVLLLEDLHWADSASLDLFEHLAFALSHRAASAKLDLLVVASLRPTPPDHRLARAVERIGREPIAQVIDLAPLTDSDVLEVMNRAGIERPSAHLVHRMNTVTSGNPLFLREVIDNLVHRGELVRQGATLRSQPSADLELPQSLKDAIADRTGRLSASSRELVTLAALLGTRFGFDPLAAIAGRSADSLIDLLDEAVALGVLIDEGHRYRFAHPLIQQVMSRAPSPTRRQRLHLQIATHLQRVSDAGSPASDLDIALHLVRAGSLADRTQLMRYANLAAEHALDRYAWHEAAEQLEVAIAASEGATGVSPLDVAELHRKAGLAYFRQYDSGPCVAHYEAAAAAFRAAQDAPGLARTLNDRSRASVWLGLVPYGDPADSKALEGALERLDPGDRKLRALVLATLAEAHWTALNTVDAERFGSEALRLASEIGDHRLCAEASINLGLICYQGLRIDEALSIWSEGRAHAKRVDDLFAEERCLLRSVLALMSSGRLDEARRAALEVQQMSEILQTAGESSLAHCSLLDIAVLHGDLAAAERHGQDALDQLRLVKYPWAAFMTVPALACARAMRGDAASARKVIQLFVEPGVMFEDPRFFEPRARDLGRLVDCLCGDGDQVALTGTMRFAKLAPPYDLTQLVDACAAVEFADALQSPALAAEAAPILEAAEQQGFFFLSGWPFFVVRLRGVIALLEGEWDAAIEQFTRAMDIADRAGTPPEGARSSLDLARALAARDADGDRDRARELLTRGLPTLRACFPGTPLVRAEKLSAFLGAKLVTLEQ